MNTPPIVLRQKSPFPNFVMLVTVMMFLRVFSYFMLSESVAITQAIKIGLRVSLSGGVFLLYRYLVYKSELVRFKYENLLSLLFYCAYLLLGIASFLWTSSLPVSALQMLMDVECLFFVYFFQKMVTLYNSSEHVSVEKKNAIEVSSVMASVVFWIAVYFLVGMYIDREKFYRLTHGGEVARLGGFIINPNELGMLLVIGAAMCSIEIINKPKKRIWLIIQLIIIMYDLVLTGSRSSTIGFLLIVFYYINLSDNYKLKIAVYSGMLMSIPVIINVIFIKVGDLEEVMSLTGRLPFWQDLLNDGFPKEPLLGYGFMRIAYGDRFESLHSYAGAMTHNTFIQVLMNLGLIGALIVFLQMFYTIYGMITCKDVNIKMTCIGIFIPTMINSLTEFGFFGETNYGIMFYLMLIMMLVLRMDDQLSRMDKLKLKAVTLNNRFVYRKDT